MLRQSTPAGAKQDKRRESFVDSGKGRASRHARASLRHAPVLGRWSEPQASAPAVSLLDSAPVRRQSSPCPNILMLLPPAALLRSQVPRCGKSAARPNPSSPRKIRPRTVRVVDPAGKALPQSSRGCKEKIPSAERTSPKVRFANRRDQTQ